MKKNNPKKLTLCRETLTNLAKPEMAQVVGGIVETDDRACMRTGPVKTNIG